MPTCDASLPPYALRVSARSRRVRLVITPEKGLTVVVPPGFDPGLAPDIVRDRLDWVNHHLEKARAVRPEAILPPARVELRAVGKVLAVRYRAGARAGGGSLPSAAELPGGTGGVEGLLGSGAAASSSPASGRSVRVRACGPASLDVSGDIACRELVARGLQLWLKREAASLLPPWLEAEAGRLGLSHAGVTIRLQRTRWGSCSAKGGISLNARLLFLPRELAGYVLAHELAHTVHLNHSGKYWRFLESVCPGALALDRALRNARQYVPDWARG